MVHGITPEKRRAAVTALGYDPDHVVSLSMGTDHATLLVVDLDTDGRPQVIDGALLTTSLTGPIQEPEEEDEEPQ